MREIVCAALVLAATGLAGCASVRSGAQSVQSGAQSVHDHIPFMYHEQKVAAGDPTPTTEREAHRQYYDKLHKRYYYYDPVKKAYFWENGLPKD